MARRIHTGPLLALTVGWSILLANVLRWAPTVPATHVFQRDAVVAVVVIAWTVALVPLLTRAVDAGRVRLDGTPTVPGPASAARPGNRPTPDLYDWDHTP